MAYKIVFSSGVSHFTDEAKSARFKPHPMLMIVIFIGIMAVSQFIPMGIMLPLNHAIKPMFTDSPAMYSGLMAGFNLILTATGIIAAIVYCRLIERRSLASMGLVRDKCVRNYVLGAVLGTIMFAASVGICVIAGAVHYSGTDMYNIPVFAVICAGWLIQGAEEEILCRGLLMGSLSARMPLWGAVLINSAFFSVLHIFNGGFNPVVFVNLTLFGLFMSVMALRFDSIIPCCAAHSLWNLTQGNIFGLPVSGTSSGPSVWRLELLPNMELWTGGTFGIEGGLGTTVVLGVLIICLMFVRKSNSE